ncbi:MAG TPA: DUF4351 domain-containing protein, partial [Nostocaceae cyanobacterium]|nr:DUF4351 domain-containing protein [Nostocaceae cyanobacterium]
PESKQSIIDIITKILSYQFTNLTRLEIEAMLGITIEQTRLYQDIKEEGKREGREEGRVEGKREGEIGGERKIVLRILTKRFGEVPEELKSQIEKLSLEQLETLGEDLLDFVSLDDLAAWLKKIQVPEE